MFFVLRVVILWQNYDKMTFLHHNIMNFEIFGKIVRKPYLRLRLKSCFGQNEFLHKFSTLKFYPLLQFFLRYLQTVFCNLYTNLVATN